MAAAVLKRDDVADWFGDLSFDDQDAVLTHLETVFEKGKARRLAELRAEMERLEARGSGKKKKGSTAAPKYINPDDPTQTWAGRGKKPKWVEVHLENGGTLDELAIN